MYDHYVPALVDSIIVALRVPDAVHALPARDLPGRAAGDVRVPDRDLRAHRPAGLQRVASTRAPPPSAAAGYLAKLAQRPHAASSSPRGVHPHCRETLETLRARLRHRGRRGPRCATASPTPPRSPRRSTTTPPRSSSAARTSSARSRTSRRSRAAAKATGALLVVAVRPAARSACSSRPASSAPTSPSARASRSATGSTSAARRSASSPRPRSYIRRMPGRIAGETRRRRRPPRLRAHAPDARAAHPPREGDLEHLHRPGAQRARRASIYLSWLGRRGIVELGELMLQRTAYARETLARARRRRARCTSSRSSASSRVELDAPVDAGHRALRGRRASTPAIRWPRLPRVERRPAGRDHRAALARGHRPARRGARRAVAASEPWRARSTTGCTRPEIEGDRPTRPRRRRADAEQRDRATTIYERSSRAGARSSLPALDVPEQPLDELLPGALRRARAAAAARGRRARDRPPLHAALAAQLRPRHGLLPARLVHDEAQPEAARARRRAARLRPPAPAAGPEPRAGRARADVELAAARSREIAGLPHVVAAAGAPGSHGELAGVLLTRAYHEDRGETPHEGPHARHRARHQPGDGDDGRLRGRQGRHRRATAASTSTTCAPRPTTTSPA